MASPKRKKNNIPLRKKTGRAPSEGLPPVSVAAPKPDWLQPAGLIGGVAGFAFLGLGLLVSPQNRYFLPPGFYFPFQSPFLFFLFGIVLLAVTFRSLPGRKENSDLPPWFAGLCLLALLALGFYFRLTQINIPMSFYWDGVAASVTDSRNVLELKQNIYNYPTPLFNYWMSFIWSFFPNATGLFMQRFASTLMDMATVWMLYFIGKEIGGRRMGLIAAGIGAMTELLVTEAIRGMLVVSTPFAVALGALMTLRVIRQPTWLRFIQWGLALGLAVYSYASIRPFIPFFVLAVFAWILRAHREEAPKTAAARFLVFGGLLAFFFLYLWRNQILTMSAAPLSILVNPLFQIIFLLALAGTFYLTYQTALQTGKGWLWVRWTAAVALAWVLISPLAYLPNFPTGGLSWAVGSNFVRAVNALFFGQGEWGYSDFDFHTAAAILFSLVFVLTRPSWTGGGILAAILVGLSALFMSAQTNHANSNACAVPFIVLAAYGLNGFWDSLETAGTRKIWPRIFLLLVLGYGVWAGQSTYGKIFTLWLGHDSAESLFAKTVHKDASLGRIYMANYTYYVSPGSQGVLDEGCPLYLLQTQNPVCLLPGEAPKSVVVLMSGADKEHRKLIQDQYPKTQWQDYPFPGQNPGDPAPVVQAVIPPEEINEKPGKLFQLVQLPESSWRRRHYYGLYGLAHGMIELEDSAVSPYLPPLRGGVGSESLEGIFRAPVAGKYIFSTVAGNFVVLYIDGKKIMDVRPEVGTEKVSESVKLSAGPHTVRDLEFIHDEPGPPLITVTGPDGIPGTLGAPPPAP